jgi:hypothetical protein
MKSNSRALQLGCKRAQAASTPPHLARVQTMPPSIPTHRPLVTATRSAILIAAIAVGCSVFLAVDSAYGRLATPALVPVAGLACEPLAAERESRDLASRAGDDRLVAQ